MEIHLGQAKSNHRLCSVCELRAIVMAVHVWSSHEPPCHPRSRPSHATAESLARRVNEISSGFTIDQQEDPSELFIFLLAHISQCLPPAESIAIDITGSDIIQQMFGVHMRSTITCGRCQTRTVKRDCELMWSVAITSQTDLRRCLSDEFDVETMAGINAYYCSRCAGNVQAKKSIRLTKTSPLLVLHLKRFTYDKQSYTAEKIQKSISYPRSIDLIGYFEETFDEIEQPDEQGFYLTYHLYAVIVHCGEMPNSGHIYALIKSPDGFWYKADDASVTRVANDQALSERHAYMLFYYQANEDTIDSHGIETARGPLQSTPYASKSRAHIDDAAAYRNEVSHLTNFLSKRSLFLCISCTMKDRCDARFDLNNAQEETHYQRSHTDDNRLIHEENDASLVSSVSYRYRPSASMNATSTPIHRSNTSVIGTASGEYRSLICSSLDGTEVKGMNDRMKHLDFRSLHQVPR